MIVKNSIEKQPNTNTGKGRKPGAKNIVNQELRGIMAEIVAGELEKVPETLERVRSSKPDKYVQLVIRLAEVCLPRQQQVELSTDNQIDVKATLDDLRTKLTEDN